jgi:hypothetical protein
MRLASLLLLGVPSLLAAQRTVEGNRVISKALPAAELEAANDLSYAGTLSFELYNVANVEQHFFVERDGARVKRLLWIQFEGYKPDNTHTYNYTDSTITHSGQTWHRRRVPFRIPDTEARPDSDGARVRAHIREKGWSLGPDVLMERLVWILDSPARNELMVIYMEDLADQGLTVADLRVGGKAADRWPAIGEAFHQRALAAFSVRRET